MQSIINETKHYRYTFSVLGIVTATTVSCDSSFVFRYDVKNVESIVFVSNPSVNND